LNFTPANATDKSVSIEVRDPSIINLWEDGQAIIYKDAIHARAEGSTYLVFTTGDGDFKDSCLVTVKRIHLTSFQLSLHEKTLWLPYSQSGEYINVNDTSELRILLNPLNATDKSYTVAVRNKGVVEADQYGIQAMREGATYVVFTANDGHLQDSILIHVTRTVNGGSPCENAAVAQLGVNNMPAAEHHTEWFQFTPSETAHYALTINVEKYPFTDAEVYSGDCSSLYLVNDGRLWSANYTDSYGAGFFGETGKTFYLKLTTGDYNTQGGGTIVSYTWKIAKISASISGAVTDNGASAQGVVELYSVKKGSVSLLQTAAIQANGNYQFDNLGIGDYAVRAVTTAGDITWYGSNTPYFIESAVISPAGSEAITGKDIDIVRRETLNEGNAKISGYIVKNEDVASQNSPSIRRVQSAEGKPAEGITVFLLRSGETAPINYTLTDAGGYFEFTGIGTGEYNVRVQVAGLEPETTAVSITEDGETVEIAYEVSETGIEETGGTGLATVAVANVRIYPNPVTGILHVTGAKNAVLTVHNLQGHPVYSKNKLSAEENIVVSSWAKGLYIILIQTENEKICKKIVKN
ncbi:MAG: carboxypeptidase regulatory-like domain-containing protein, partial [Tannerella sp.]|nr:carboxypeptidase regulatory-like domain-containing protein [Tannerella sp.]